MRSSSSEIGESLADALGALDEQSISEIQSALGYAHFCEIMPMVRNGYLRVEHAERGFELVHPSPQFSHHEQCDVIASEMALPFLERPFPFRVSTLLKMSSDWPRLVAEDFLLLLMDSYRHHFASIYERELLSSADYLKAFDFERDDYLRVRAALMSLASWCIGMAAAAESKAIGAANDAEHWQKECMEWASPLLKVSFVRSLIGELAGVSDSRVDRILSVFTDTPFGTGQCISGDGYLAPIVQIGDSFLFSPRGLLIMLGERNIVYVANKTNKRHFDEYVSSSLEVALLDRAGKALSCIGGLVVRKNVVWKHGEIDLLAYSPKTNTALHVQAKAPIPPQGARMTRQVETNSLHAIRQLAAFDSQPTSDKDAILCNTFGLDIANAKWASAVLASSSFGTSSAWSALQGIAALNPPLLTHVSRRMIQESNANLLDVPSLAAKSLDEIVARTSRGWTRQTISVFGTDVSFPGLLLDYEAIGKVQLECSER
ncbi:hypothetical protein N2605_00205 [Bradyrhizobium yuanmingense]|uniref:hypothetical protein n=1 Tax=Bradyrhizobium yuanmingense TaxID=108015 RepID=UPI0021A52CC6|nr:hypothetical protein [Bradyrhizobium sp. CB1024]UWU84922.1 hypothetical protein N2605_00205 [Bradyrhizobium sp. CB1024]